MGIEIFSFPGEGFKGFRGFKVFILHASLGLGQYIGEACVFPRGVLRLYRLWVAHRSSIGPLCVFVDCLFYVMIILWVVVYKIEQNDHRRDQRACALYLCYAHPSVRLGLRLLWTLCLLPCRCTGRL